MSKTDKVTDKWCDEEDYDSEDGEFGLDAKAPQKVAPRVYKKKEEEKVIVDSPVEHTDFGQSDSNLKLGQGQGSQSEDTSKPRERMERNNRTKDDRGDRRNQKRDNKDREPREPREFNFNPNSNYRIYYLNDPLFYEVVIKKEEAPYEFKIHLFLDGESELSSREITTQVMEKLNTFGASNIKDTIMVRDRNEHSKNDKIRYMFQVHEKEQALACYRFFMHYNKNTEKGTKDDILSLPQQMKIYLQKEEPIFEKYGDEEAELYEEMVQMEKMMAAQNPQKPKKRYDQPGGGYNKETSKQDAEQLGFNFSRGGPPRFKNDKKKDAPKEEAPERQIVDKTQNLREVINKEKATEQRGEKRTRGDNENRRGGGERRRGGGGPPQQEEEKKQYKVRENRGGQNGEKRNQPRKQGNDEYGVEEVDNRNFDRKQNDDQGQPKEYNKKPYQNKKEYVPKGDRPNDSRQGGQRGDRGGRGGRGDRGDRGGRPNDRKQQPQREFAKHQQVEEKVVKKSTNRFAAMDSDD